MNIHNEQTKEVNNARDNQRKVFVSKLIDIAGVSEEYADAAFYATCSKITSTSMTVDAAVKYAGRFNLVK